MNRIALAVVALMVLAVGLAACADQMDPVGVSAHPDGWVQPASSNFHGAFVLESAKNAESCATCHGSDFDGGTSGVSCYASGCHAGVGGYPHPEGFARTEAADFHGEVIEEGNLWDLALCRSCHGENYAGMGDPEKSCLTCHDEEDGPENCMTCHGDASSIGPPPDVEGNTSPTARGVGVHLAHTGAKQWTSALAPECSQCHVVPTFHTAPGHVDDPGARAEVNFKLIATHFGRVQPVYDMETATCSNVYCHGSFTFLKEESEYPWAYTADAMTGNDLVLGWTDINTELVCGDCHGLPPTGHIPATTCHDCHGDVVDANLNIIDKGKHINGQVDVDVE